MWDKLKEQFNLLKLEKKHLCMITNSDKFLSKDDFLDAVASALQGGVDMVMLNEKNIPDSTVVDIGRKIRILCDEYGATYIVNDRADIALITEADGVHLEPQGISVADVRELASHNTIIGKTVYTIDELKRAKTDGADYILLSPQNGEVLPDIDLIFEARDNCEIPIFITGKINTANVNDVLQFGINKLALADELMYAKIPELKAREFIKQIY